jgi:cytoskeletal protein CcmA (bactofilin family)
MIDCSGRFKISGKSVFSQSIKAKQIRSSGTLCCDGDLIAEDDISCSGGVSCKKGIKCEQLRVCGSLHIDGDIEAENVNLAGGLCCGGLLNAENIRIQADKPMHVASIGGSSITIKRKRISIFPRRRVEVATAIEGDQISLEYVSCPRVTGRSITVGRGCVIDLVQYSESIEISPKAKILKTEKI